MFPVLMFGAVGIGIVGAVFSVNSFDKEKLDKRIQNRKNKQYYLQKDLQEKINTIDPVVIPEEEFDDQPPLDEQLMIDTALFPTLFPNGFRPSIDGKKIPEDLWEQIKNISKGEEEALYIAGLTYKESSWRADCIGDHHANGSFGFTQINRKYHSKTANNIYPSFFEKEEIWQDPYWNLTVFKEVLNNHTSKHADNWFDRVLCYNVGPDKVGPKNDPNRGKRYAQKITEYVRLFKSQLNTHEYANTQ